MTDAIDVVGDRDDGLTSLLGEGPIPFPSRIAREFMPWHRPRKQYVRNLQWAKELGYLARDLNMSRGELRYLTLPGSDLLDIRHIHDVVCMPSSIRLKYLGFNTAAQPSDTNQSELNSTEFSVKRLGFIHPESEVFPGDIRSVGDVSSISWKRVKRAGFFHAINFDLCGGFAGAESVDGIPNYFTALQALLQSQSGTQEDFLLFITTRMDDDSIGIEAKQSLNSIAQRIYGTSRSYAEEFDLAWDVSPDDARNVVISETVRPTEAFMIGLTQWIVARGIDVGLKAQVKSFMTYRTGDEPGDDDLVSLAIRFRPDPVIRVDPDGLVRPIRIPPSRAEKEGEQSRAIPGKVSRRVLVDAVLREQVAEFERCVQESSVLLGSAGYDSAAYVDWVASRSTL